MSNKTDSYCRFPDCLNYLLILAPVFNVGMISGICNFIFCLAGMKQQVTDISF